MVKTINVQLVPIGTSVSLVTPVGKFPVSVTVVMEVVGQAENFPFFIYNFFETYRNPSLQLKLIQKVESLLALSL